MAVAGQFATAAVAVTYDVEDRVGTEFSKRLRLSVVFYNSIASLSLTRPSTCLNIQGKGV